MIDLGVTGGLVVGAYLIGAVPFGLLIGLARGVDVRQQGSRNIGATNVGRVLGGGWGKLCLVLDILKGMLPTLAARAVLIGPEPATGALLCWLLVAVAAVAGHVFPVYLGFRGGKGVATTIGVALGVYPVFTVSIFMAVAAYAAVRFTTGLVSLGSLTIALVFPLAVYGQLWYTGRALSVFWPLEVVAILLGLLIVVRHRGNIRRLRRGEEYRPAATSAGGPEEKRSGAA
ncbi:MAG: glycerol-3-phosphate 1-O-acyltransferase PlsY [Phycisphaerae bacterium]